MEPTASQSYIAKTPVFEGPLEVLLEMIEKRKLFINEISLASVAEDYITYVKNISHETDKHIHDITSFVVVAATLILIKSRSLLPNLELAPDEEQAIDDLEKRLRLYQKVQELGGLIKIQFGKQIIGVRDEALDIGPVWSPDPKVTLDSMLASLRDVFHALPKVEVLPEVSVKKVVSIEEMMSSLEDRITNALQMSFRDFSKAPTSHEPKEKKVHVIVSFLAMLELVRNGLVDVIQNNQFDDMMITKQEEDTHSELSINEESIA